MANGWLLIQLPILISDRLSIIICNLFTFRCAVHLYEFDYSKRNNYSSPSFIVYQVSSPSQWHFDTFCKLFPIDTTQYIELATVIYKHKQPISHCRAWATDDGVCARHNNMGLPFHAKCVQIFWIENLKMPNELYALVIFD